MEGVSTAATEWAWRSRFARAECIGGVRIIFGMRWAVRPQKERVWLTVGKMWPWTVYRWLRPCGSTIPSFVEFCCFSFSKFELFLSIINILVIIIIPPSGWLLEIIPWWPFLTSWLHFIHHLFGVQGTIKDLLLVSQDKKLIAFVRANIICIKK